MLTMLFLLFVLSGSSSLVNSNELDTAEMLIVVEETRIYNELLFYKGENNVAYYHWKDIPVMSPIHVRDIKDITSDYGYRVHPIYQIWSMHDGIDFSAALGTDIFSTAEGTITKIKRSKHGYGNEVIITHKNGYSTRYAHLNEIHIEEGQRVSKNTCVGTVGTTGLSTGPHLHYEVLLNNKSIDPMSFTYSDVKKRSLGKYFTTLIALES